MGNICSRSKNSPDLFSQPGRPLGSSNPSNATPRAPLPTKSKSNFGSPGRTLGETRGPSGDDDARRKAADAAQKRAESNTTGKGKLGTKLAAQKAQTHTQTLNEASRDERAARDADGAAAARRWD